MPYPDSSVGTGTRGAVKHLLGSGNRTIPGAGRACVIVGLAALILALPVVADRAPPALLLEEAGAEIVARERFFGVVGAAHFAGVTELGSAHGVAIPVLADQRVTAV